MGWAFDVYGWTFGDRHGVGREEWHYAPLYQGNSLLVALWTAFRARAHYGCVKLELRQ